MKISDLQQQVKIQRKIETTDGGGGLSKSWEDVATTRAQIVPMSGQEKMFADKLEERITHKIIMRWRDDITHSNRIVYSFTRGGANYERVFNVKRVINQGTKYRFLDIRVVEGVAT